MRRRELLEGAGFSILLGSLLSASRRATAEPQLTKEPTNRIRVTREYPIHRGEGIQTAPSISVDGDFVIWHNIVPGELVDASSIWGKDLKTGEVFPIAIQGATNNGDGISEGNFPYAHGYGHFTSEIHVYDLRTRQDRLVADGASY